MKLLKQAPNPVPNPVLTADSLATGNYKDVLNSFFQLGFEKFTGPAKEFKFTATPFAVMAKLDTTLLVDTSYIRYRTLRNLNFSFSAKLDSSFKFNGFSSGIKYALINKRDETVSRAFVNTVLGNVSTKQLFALNSLISEQISKMPESEKSKAILDYTDFTDGVKNFGALSQALQDTILAIAGRDDATKTLAQTIGRNKNFNLKKTADSLYQDMKANFNKNLLWTIGISDTTYKDEFIFSNIVITSELLQGLNNYNERKNDLELNIKTALQLVDDSTRSGRDLKRVLFSFEPGINLAFKTRGTKKSYLEIKFSGGYYHNFSYLYQDEERDRFTMNTTLRVRVFSDIWIPLDIKYDPKSGNLFGYLNVRANFKALGNAAKQLF
ncbi:MAG: hypothetical protein ABW019_12390 [Chitinophagaceae bacterium]